MRITRKKTLAALAVSTIALGLILPAGTAQADLAPSSSDIVGVGSDTLQYMLDFGADGDLNGNLGYNPSKLARLVSIDATPDSNARAGYLNGSTNASLLPLNPTVVLRRRHLAGSAAQRIGRRLGGARSRHRGNPRSRLRPLVVGTGLPRCRNPRRTPGPRDPRASPPRRRRMHHPCRRRNCWPSTPARTPPGRRSAARPPTRSCR